MGNIGNRVFAAALTTSITLQDAASAPSSKVELAINTEVLNDTFSATIGGVPLKPVISHQNTFGASTTAIFELWASDPTWPGAGTHAVVVTAGTGTSPSLVVEQIYNVEQSDQSSVAVSSQTNQTSAISSSLTAPRAGLVKVYTHHGGLAAQDFTGTPTTGGTAPGTSYVRVGDIDGSSTIGVEAVRSVTGAGTSDATESTIAQMNNRCTMVQVFHADLASSVAPTILTPTLYPANGATGVGVSGYAIAAFSTIVQAQGTPGTFSLKRVSDDATIISLDADDPSLIYDGSIVWFPYSGLSELTEYYIEVESTALEEPGANTPFAGISGSGTWSFTTGVTISPTAVRAGFLVSSTGAATGDSTGAGYPQRTANNLSNVDRKGSSALVTGSAGETNFNGAPDAYVNPNPARINAAFAPHPAENLPRLLEHDPHFVIDAQNTDITEFLNDGVATLGEMTTAILTESLHAIEAKRVACAAAGVPYRITNGQPKNPTSGVSTLHHEGLKAYKDAIEAAYPDIFLDTYSVLSDGSSNGANGYGHLAAGFDSGDGRHPNDLGHQALADYLTTVAYVQASVGAVASPHTDHATGAHRVYWEVGRGTISSAGNVTRQNDLGTGRRPASPGGSIMADFTVPGGTNAPALSTASNNRPAIEFDGNNSEALQHVQSSTEIELLADANNACCEWYLCEVVSGEADWVWFYSHGDGASDNSYYGCNLKNSGANHALNRRNAVSGGGDQIIAATAHGGGLRVVRARNTGTALYISIDGGAETGPIASTIAINTNRLTFGGLGRTGVNFSTFVHRAVAYFAAAGAPSAQALASTDTYFLALALDVAFPGPISSTVVVPSPALTHVSFSVAPGAIPSGSTVPTPAVAANGSLDIAPSVITSGSTAQSPGVSASGSVQVTPGTPPGGAVVPSPAVGASGSSLAPSAITSGSTAPNPGVSPSGLAQVAPGTIAGGSTAPAPNVSASGSVQVTPGATPGGAVVPSPAVTAPGALLAPSAISSGVVVPSPTVPAINAAPLGVDTVASTSTVPSVTVILVVDPSLGPLGVTVSISDPASGFIKIARLPPYALGKYEVPYGSTFRLGKTITLTAASGGFSGSNVVARFGKRGWPGVASIEKQSVLSEFSAVEVSPGVLRVTGLSLTPAEVAQLYASVGSRIVLEIRLEHQTLSDSDPIAETVLSITGGIS